MFGRRRSSKKRSNDDGAVLDSLADTDNTVEQATTSGPYDVKDALEDDDNGRQLDLGAFRLPIPSGVGFQAQTDSKGNVGKVTLSAGKSGMQLMLRAAPRSEGIWDELQEDIVAQISSQGGSYESTDGEWGTEIVAKVPGKKGTSTVRFVGVDGPRWLLTATFQGEIAANPEAAPELTEAFRNIVVDRGNNAMPVREPLPLRLPPKMAEQAAAQIEERKKQGGESDRAVIAAGDTKTPKVRRKPSPKPRK
ncbi:DUF3710 domain-containing protein [Haloglycomyces albus]|uniref:DUF3710 domain-containing protein n=1 Tax=Haloglycomyces albus TaxID=526067 RepID=UPI0004ADAED6|nr:DUF3710 domain-containing protein [Haloglycomyces albus]